MNTPKSLEIAITDRCNLRCAYCSHFSSAGNVGRDLPKEEWLAFFEELGRLAVLTLTISGGEPFIREDLRDILDGIVRNRMRFGILSNGTLITDDMAAFLAATGRCNSVQISIDSSIPTTHDACRGKGSFGRAMNGIGYLRKHKVPTTVRVTINKKNVKDLDGVARLLLEEVGLPSFSTNAAMYMGLCRKNSEEMQLSPEERTLAMETLLRLNGKYDGRIKATAGPLAEGNAWAAMEACGREGKRPVEGVGCLTACGGVLTKLGVRADGGIVPCILMADFELGRINGDDLASIWRNHPTLKRLRERRSIPLSRFEFCKECDYISSCTGGCPATAYAITGDYNHPSPDGCLRLFVSEGGRLPRIESMETSDFRIR